MKIDKLEEKLKELLDDPVRGLKESSNTNKTYNSILALFEEVSKPRFYYAKKIQPEKYLGEFSAREKFQPFEIGCWGESYEEARKDVFDCIEKELEHLKSNYKALDEMDKNAPPFKGDEFNGISKEEKKRIEKGLKK